MHLDFRVKPENDRKDTFGTAPVNARKYEKASTCKHLKLVIEKIPELC